MEVIRAKRAGACYGVQRALDMADEVIADGGRAYTLGPLIHNPQVVADLAARGAEAVDSVEEIRWEGAAAAGAPADGVVPTNANAPSVVIRSHGVTPQVLAAVEDRGFSVVDATCPHVSRAQHAAAELAAEGCRVIVVGEAGHPEVEGLTAWAEEAGGKVDVVAAPEEIPEGLYDPVGVVAQTTQRRENLEAVVAALREAGLEPMVKNTICFGHAPAPGGRGRSGARPVDAMVVIGGRNSSNTTRLADVCAAHLPAHLPHRIGRRAGSGLPSPVAARVGVTAGASTPEEPDRRRREAFLRRRCSHGDLSRKRHRARGLLCTLASPATRRVSRRLPAARRLRRAARGAGGAYRDRRGAGEPGR